MLVYLGGPIDLANKDYQNWKVMCKESLKYEGISCLDPAGTFSYARSENSEDRRCTAEKLIKINEFNLLQCDIAIITLSRNVSSVGTPIELKLCKDHGIPHVVFFDGDPDNMLPAYIEGIADKVTFSIETAIQYVIDFTRVEIMEMERIENITFESKSIII